MSIVMLSRPLLGLAGEGGVGVVVVLVIVGGVGGAVEGPATVGDG